MSGPELLPCPFCGGEAETRETWGYWVIDGKHKRGCLFHVRQPSAFPNEATAITAWNQRAPSQGWQDMTSAPEAWIDVLVFSPEHEGFNCGGVFSVFYDDDDGLWLAHTQGGNMQLNPIAWQPLPTPPEKL